MLYTSEENISGLRPYHTQARDDTAWLLSRLWQLDLADLLQSHLPSVPHSRVSRSTVLLIWLTHLLSGNGLRARQLSEWAGTRLETIRRHTGQYVRPSDLDVVHLYDLIGMLGDTPRWEALENALNYQILRAEQFVPQQIRLMTIHEDAWRIADDGTLQARLRKAERNGHLRAHATIAYALPSGIPLFTTIAPAGLPRCDDVQFLEQMADWMTEHVVFLGEQVLAASDVRAAIVQRGNAYFYQLPNMTVQVSDPAQYEKAAIIDQYETQSYQAAAGAVQWAERRVAFRSAENQLAAITNLHERLGNALTAIEQLNERRRGKRCLTQVADLRAVAEETLDTFNVREYVQLHYEEDVTERVVRHYRGRPTGPRVERQLRVVASVHESLLTSARQRLGWSAYATTLTDTPAMLQPLIEQTQSSPLVQRLIGMPLSLVPPTIRQPEYAVGVWRLLMLALRCEGLIQLLDAHDASSRREWVAGDIPVV